MKSKVKKKLLPFHKKGLLEAGCDEAGRGCLAGAVFAAAVVVDAGFYHPLLNDSKQLTEKDRNLLRIYIEKKALAYSVAWVDAEVIDRINILNSSFLAMHKALEKLSLRVEHLLIDGNRFKPYRDVPFTCMIKGDGSYCSIAAASVLAKTWRDEYMAKLHAEFPHYAWDQNKGYPTVLHREGIRKFGLTPYHRRSFTLLPEQLSLEL